MNAELLLDRIVIDPRVMIGKPVIRGTRLTVEYILNLLVHGATEAEILAEYQGLARSDSQVCLLFAQSLQSTLPSSCRWAWSSPDAGPCGRVHRPLRHIDAPSARGNPCHPVAGN